MASTPETLRSDLETARAATTLVDVRRRKQLVTHQGYVVAVGAEWLLLANLDGAIVLDGYIALRIRDVTRVRRRSSAAFVQTALTLRGHWPPVPPSSGVALTDVRGLLASLRGHWPLVTLHVELDDPSVCFIGQVRRIGRKTVELREITPQATWRRPRSPYRLDRLTHIDVGGSYEQALFQVASVTAEQRPRRRVPL